MIISLILSAHQPVFAQPETAPAEPGTPIQTEERQVSDSAIAERVKAIFREIPALENVNVTVQSGVVRLSGTTTDLKATQRAEALVERVDGVVTVENLIKRDVALNRQLAPALEASRTLLQDGVARLPLLVLAVVVFLIVILLGSLLASRTRLWRRITPNEFIAELVATTLRLVFVILALVLALNLLGATALLGAVLGSAGVIGLAVGFAVRDTIENYVASIMLSLRQPFRPNDHVVINTSEGHVIRLTSRATILMTLEGNHLRIPNAQVFKATILNYTRNPERRFNFELGVDADDDPLAAIQTGVQAMDALDFVLKEPPPLGIIQQVGDSNIVIFYAAWMNQRNANFIKSRSLTIAAVKDALETNGFGLPEPIYRLRFDQSAAGLLTAPRDTTAAPERPTRTPKQARIQPQSLDVKPEHHIDDKVAHERREGHEQDLLNESIPIE